MKSEKMEKYINIFKDSSKDFSGQIIGQLDRIITFLTLKTIEPELRWIIFDALTTLEYSLRGLEWNIKIEKEWKAEIKKVADRYDKTDDGTILPRFYVEFQDKKMLIDYQYLIKMCLDIGIIDKKVEVVNENSDIRKNFNR